MCQPEGCFIHSTEWGSRHLSKLASPCAGSVRARGTSPATVSSTLPVFPPPEGFTPPPSLPFPAVRNMGRDGGRAQRAGILPAPRQSGGTLGTEVADGWPGGGASKKHTGNISAGSPEPEACGEVPPQRHCPCTTPGLNSPCAAA